MPLMQNIVGKLDNKVKLKFARTSYRELGGQLPRSEPKWPQWPKFAPSKSQMCIENNGPCLAPPGQ